MAPNAEICVPSEDAGLPGALGADEQPKKVAQRMSSRTLAADILIYTPLGTRIS